MASKGAASRAAARKQKDKWKAKRWYTIRAPRQPWHFKVIGETLGEEDQLLIGRMYEITQQEVDGDFSKMHVKLKFRVTEIIGQDAITEFAGHEVLKDHVRRQVRRYRGKVDDVIDAITEDGYYVRIKPFMITQGRVKTSQKQGIREACRNTVLQVAARNTWVSLQKLMLSGELEQMIDKAVRKVATVKTIIIRKSQLVQDGVIVEDGPTLDEIREEEDRVAAAKKAALAAAMAEEDDEEDSTPDVLAAAEAAAGDTEQDDADSSDDEEPVEENVEEEVQEEAEEAPVDESADDTPDYASMKVAELKELLKAAGKPVSGKKDELIARLME
ncbi:MAG: 30S ribosomal protein S3ae [Euryarchaeota archaeon]|nr:30S ribosomal protein S3ae [Euryarchaeota archaeon]|tara:strand:- start:851 stop:1840 length:990 start_codon:yes stop_codon:yes gene_type:complete